jgi:hypothetical protein
MADDATITLSAIILPDEIAKTLTSLSAGFTPKNADDKWYFKITATSTSQNQDLISGAFISEEAVGTAHDTVHVDDKVEFLFVKNTDGSNDVYLTLDGNASNATSDVDAIKIPAGKVWFGNLPNTTVGNLHVIANSGTPACIVAAIIDDVA